MPIFDAAETVLDAAWSLAFGQLGDGVAVTGRANGYTATSATAGKAIRATTYTPQGANGQRSVNSTNAADAAAGTGARSITINYLTAAFVLKSETVTLNGVTGVNTVANDIAYIESIIVNTVGSGGGNAGVVQVWTGLAAAGAVWGSIAIGDNQTFWAHHYVLSGVSCYILSVSGAAQVVAGQVNMNRVGDPSAAGLPQLQIGPTLMHPASDKKDHYFAVPLKVTGPDLIFLTTKPNAVTADTSFGYFDYVQF
jgi:hypothetical protein